MLKLHWIVNEAGHLVMAWKVEAGRDADIRAINPIPAASVPRPAGR